MIDTTLLIYATAVAVVGSFIAYLYRYWREKKRTDRRHKFWFVLKAFIICFSLAYVYLNYSSQEVLPLVEPTMEIPVQVEVAPAVEIELPVETPLEIPDTTPVIQQGLMSQRTTPKYHRGLVPM